ncbi:hypothetical protein AQUCO_01400607v1 [Aquilegia coerulea]|uniref:Strictosidine synthase conserved region domain-containing protein n=1 Tax=Aquilegia coerulea TaxID=218851 RepID=A0A2G5DXA3_AQUCA|nr:hypothetical protein AQUCO_01400607v1 [Aquilegia coerulea]
MCCAATVAIFSIFLTSVLVHIFSIPPIPGSRDILHGSEIVNFVEATGPESLAFDPNGNGPYTGVADGRILKWQGEGLGWTEFAYTSPQRKDCVHANAPVMEHVCGRPLGLKFHSKSGDLYIADAYFGIQIVGPNGGLSTQIIKEAENEPFRFTNDLDIDEDNNVIYFTDSSTVFQRRQFVAALLSDDKTGRLLKYEQSTKQVKVLMRGLTFANGVALSKDNSFVLVAETKRCRILRYWLQGPKTGSWDVFAELPGFPDNIRRNSKGEFWVALHSKKARVTEWALANPWVGKLLLKLPLNYKQLHYIMVGGKRYATAIKLSAEGQVLEVLEDSKGKTMRFISEVEERNGKLWIGSVMMPFVGQFNLF